MEEKIFDYSESEGDVFWSEYCKNENRRFRKLKMNEEMDPWSWQYIWEVIFFQRVRDADKEFEPVALAPKLLYWVGRSWRRENFEDEANEKPFRLSFINSMEKLVVFVILFAMACIATIVTIIHVVHGEKPCHSNSSFVSWSDSYYGEWLTVLSTCLLFFIVKQIPPSLRKIIFLDLYDMWNGIGFFVLCLRLFQLLKYITSYLQDNATSVYSHCYSLPESSNGVTQARFFILMIVASDFILSFAISILPFAWPWILYYCIIMIFTTCLRLQTCISLLGIPESQLYVLKICIGCCTVVSYIAVIAIFSYSSVRSMKSTFINVRYQTQLVQESNRMVDLLCSDAKIAVRSALKSYDEIFATTRYALQLKNHRDKMKLAGEVLQHAIDLMLFLVKVGEGRHRVSFKNAVRLEGLVTNEVLKYGNSVSLYTQGQEQLHIRVNIPNCLVFVDAACLQAMIYYGLSVAHSVFHHDASNRNSASMNNMIIVIATEIDLCIDEKKILLFKDRIQPGHQLCMTTMTIASTNPVARNEQDCSLDPLVRALNSIIGGIVNLFEGSYAIFEGRICFSFYLSMDVARPENKILFPNLISLERSQSVVFNIDPHPASVESVNNTFRGIMADDEAVNELTLFLNKECCVFSTNSTLEPFLMDLVSQIVFSDSIVPITLWRELNVTDIRIRKVIFVQSEWAARALRDAGFRCMIVLCSEKLAYLDVEVLSIPLFDFVISLPASPEEISRLRTFLCHVLCMEDFSFSDDVSCRESSHFGDSLEPGKSDNSITYVVSYSVKQIRELYHFFQSFTVWNLPEKLIETYAKWRFLNPANDLYHHTANVEYFSILSIFLLIVFLICGFIAVHVFVINLAMTTLLLFRRSLHRGLANNISMRQLWSLCAILNVIFIFSSIVGGLLRIVSTTKKHSILVSLFQEPTENFAQMLGSYGKGSFEQGKDALQFFINSPMNLRYSSEFFPWPISVLTLFLYCVRYFLLVYTYFQPLMYGWQYVIIVVLVSFFVGLMVMFHRESENRMREEFLQLHSLVSSRRFFDSCLLVTRRVQDALQLLSVSQQATVLCLVDKILQENILVGNVLLQQVHELHRQQAISDEIALELQGANVSPISVGTSMSGSILGSEDSWNDDLVAQLRAVLIRPLIASICARFGESISIHQPNSSSLSSSVTASIASTSTMVFFRVDPDVMLIRTDPYLLRSVTTKLLREACRQIEEASTVHAKSRSTKHQILIWLKAVSCHSYPYRFTDVRRMDVVCLHSAGIGELDICHNIHQTIQFRPVLHPSLQYSPSITHPVNKYLPLFCREGVSSLFSPYGSGNMTARPQCALFEEGVIDRHGTYKLYQRYTLPYVLTPRSERFKQIIQMLPSLFQSPANSVRRASTRFFPLCRTIYLQHLAAIGQSQHIIGDTPFEVDSLPSLDSRRPYTPIKASSSTSSMTADGEKSGSVPSPIAFRPRFTGRCSLYCQPYGFLSTMDRLSMTTLMRFTQWAVVNYHPDPLPSAHSYQHADCLLIEYHRPRIHEARGMDYTPQQSQHFSSLYEIHNKPNSVEALEIWLEQRRQAWQADQAKNYEYDVVELMNFVRMEGFLGVIIVLLPSMISEADEGAAREEVLESNVFREAVRADLCLKLPLDTNKIRVIVELCERRLVELSLSCC
jgi:hypothetical protein